MVKGTILTACALLTSLLAAPLRANTHDTLLEGAKKEGSLVLYTSMTVEQAQKLNDAFRVKYPFLQVQMFRAVGERLLTKIMTETQAGASTSMSSSPPRPRLIFSRRETCWPDIIHPKPNSCRKVSSMPTGFGRRFT